jgi:hypothetical protein
MKMYLEYDPRALSKHYDAVGIVDLEAP